MGENLQSFFEGRSQAGVNFQLLVINHRDSLLVVVLLISDEKREFHLGDLDFVVGFLLQHSMKGIHTFLTEN